MITEISKTVKQRVIQKAILLRDKVANKEITHEQAKKILNNNIILI